MNGPALAAFVLAAAASAGDLTAILRHDKRLESATKPAVMAFLIAGALLIHPTSQGERALFVVALVLGLVGDLFLMLPDDFLLPGIGAFLAGHLAYAIGFRLAGFSATASGNLVAAAGGLLFFFSDVIFAWYRFVKPVRWGQPVNIVMYQAGQALLVLSLAVSA